MNLSASCPNLVEAAAGAPPQLTGVSVLSPNTMSFDEDPDEDINNACSFQNRRLAKRWHKSGHRHHQPHNRRVPVIVISSAPKLTVMESTEGCQEDERSCLGKSMEVLATAQSESEVGPFRREIGVGGTEEEAFLPTALHGRLENPESETRWYFKYFLGKAHYNYLCYDHEKNPFFLSVVSSESRYHCILWMKTGNKRLSIEGTSNGKWPSPKTILEKFSITKYDKNIREVNMASLQRDLLTLEEQEGAVNFKFGVLYAIAGQCTDDDMFSNQHGSTEFTEFLNLLGDEVELVGWEHYKGGLDTKRNATGTHSVYTVYEGHEIMFHVSTKLPYSEGNKQQLERKRHIGNDIVVIIFVDGEDNAAYNHALNFKPSFCMKSHFNHIFALVTYCKGQGTYRVVMHMATKVPSFGPPIPPKEEFTNHIAFRNFLLAKLINGEKAAYRTPTFAEKKERTLDLLLKDLEQKCNTEYKQFLGPSIAASASPAANSNRKFQAMDESFLDYGQRLKVEKIITGHHPTSQRTTAVRNDPWEIQCLATDFQYGITCGDSCDDGSLIVATPSNGTFVVSRGGNCSLVIDSSVQIGQLVIAQKHDVMLFRTCYSKDNNYLYCIYLDDLCSEKVKVNSKVAIVPYQISNTKGCHLFCTSPLDSPFLQVAAAIKNRVDMMAWKYPARLSISSPATPTRTSNPVESFIKHRELTLQEPPCLMTLVDERPTGKLCVSYQEQKKTVVDIIDEVKAAPQRIPNLDIAKDKLYTLCGMHYAGKSEVLLGHGLTTLLLSLSDSALSTSSKIVWNSEPKNIVYMAPYILAFTSNSIEIRKADNGSLMQTINAPDVHMFSHKGDIYFTSPLRLSNCRFDKPDFKSPHRSVERRTSQPTRLPSNSDMVNLYKISADNLTGGSYRRASSTSTCSSTSASDNVRTSTSDDNGSDTFSTDNNAMQGSPGVVRASKEGTGVTYNHVLVPCNVEVNGNGSPNGTRKRFNRKAPFLARPILLEADSETTGQQLHRENVSREHSVCSSPDSGVLTDDCSTTLSDWKTKSLTTPGSQTSPPPTSITDSA